MYHFSNHRHNVQFLSTLFCEYIVSCTIKYMITFDNSATLNINALSRFGHALSDPTRVQILTLLSEKSHYPADMADRLEVTRQSISNHLACLKGCGLVVPEADGRRTRYKLADERIKHALSDLGQVVLRTDPELCNQSRSEDCC